MAQLELKMSGTNYIAKKLAEKYLSKKVIYRKMYKFNYNFED